MLRMDQVYVIRHKVLMEGLSQRRTAEQLGISRNTVRKYVSQSEPIFQSKQQQEPTKYRSHVSLPVYRSLPVPVA